MPLKEHYRTCRECHTKHVFDPSDGSTWMETIESFQPMDWCPECGKMLPLLSVDESVEEEYEFVSRTAKKYVAKITAKNNNLDIEIVYNICESFRRIDVKNEFVFEFTRAVNLSFNLSLLESTIKSYF